MDTLIQDLRYGIRRLLADPALSVAAILTLTLGIGANTAIFSVVNSVLIRPLPFKDPDQLAMMWNGRGGGPRWGIFSSGDFVDYSEQNSVFQEMAAIQRTDFTLVGSGNPETFQGARVTASLFPLLGVNSLHGRLFSGEDDQPGRNMVAILSHAAWQRRFGSDVGVVGQRLTLNDQSYEIVGVLPAGFFLPAFPPNFPIPSLEPEVWTPLGLDRTRLARTGSNLFVLGRLKPGIDIKQATADTSAIAQRLGQMYPQTNSGLEVSLVSLPDQAIGDMSRVLLLLFGAVGFILLIACANVANLLLARASGRSSEMVIRSALGANRKRLIKQMLVESVLLGLVGGALGLLLAYAGIRIITSISPGSVPRVKEIGIDGWVLAFTVVLSLATSLIFGLIPALQASKIELTDTLNESGRSMAGGRGRVRSLLVVAEIALALVLLIGAGLMVRSLARLTSIDTGFKSENLLTFQIGLPRSRYDTPAKQRAFFEQALQQLEGLPSVESVGAVNFLPMAGVDAGAVITIEGAPPPDGGVFPTVSFRAISGNYFRTMGISIVAGNDLTADDVLRHHLVINESLAKRFFPNQDPIGQRIKLGRPSDPGPFLPVVAVARDIRQTGLQDPDRPTLYIALLDVPSMTMAVRTSADPLNLVSTVRSAILNIDQYQPIHNVKTMQQRLSDQSARPRFRTTLLATFAAVALLLAAVGVYGVMAYSVTRRTHEIGVRMALGADRADIVRMIMRQGFVLSLIGLGVGIVLALALARVLQTLLFEISATDLVTFIICPPILLGVALFANYFPAVRGAKVQPVTALRYQ